jgi:large subunit ribosomal protein L17
MRHAKSNNHLSRTASHRKAMLSNMACSLIMHKRISTTVAKAKVLREYVEPLITKSKTDSTHSRRVVFSKLRDKVAVAELFRTIAPKVAERPGGYTRILKTGNRLGDNADMCIIELVDFNEFYTAETTTTRRATRRGRRSRATSTPTPAPTTPTPEAETVETVETVEEPTSEVEAEVEEVEIEAKSEETEEVVAENEITEEPSSDDNTDPETEGKTDVKTE